MKRFFRRPSASLIIASLALVAALGGTSYAKSLINGKNIKNNTITSAKIKNHTLKADDFKAGQMPAGPTGPAGPKGAPGVAFGYLDYNVGTAVTIADGTQEHASVDCDPGMHPIGGGVSDSGGLYNDVNSSFPTQTGWIAYANNFSGADQTMWAYVICAQASAVTKSSKLAEVAAAKQN
jgi:hypothetical protein